jgi:hypothetical protein
MPIHSPALPGPRGLQGAHPGCLGLTSFRDEIAHGEFGRSYLIRAGFGISSGRRFNCRKVDQQISLHHRNLFDERRNERPNQLAKTSADGAS